MQNTLKLKLNKLILKNLLSIYNVTHVCERKIPSKYFYELILKFRLLTNFELKMSTKKIMKVLFVQEVLSNFDKISWTYGTTKMIYLPALLLVT